MTRAELAFSALDRNKKVGCTSCTYVQNFTELFVQGYITTKDLAKLTKKLSREEVTALMAKLDTDGDGQLSFDEFKEKFQNSEKELL